jgi:hypothetical protein
MLPLFDQPGMTCTDCGKVFDGQPADFLRYNRWADAWVTLAEEDGTVLPDYGVCKDCQDAANDAHAMEWDALAAGPLLARQTDG